MCCWPSDDGATCEQNRSKLGPLGRGTRALGSPGPSQRPASILEVRREGRLRTPGASQRGRHSLGWAPRPAQPAPGPGTHAGEASAQAGRARGRQPARCEARPDGPWSHPSPGKGRWHPGHPASLLRGVHTDTETPAGGGGGAGHTRRGDSVLCLGEHSSSAVTHAAPPPTLQTRRVRSTSLGRSAGLRPVSPRTRLCSVAASGVHPLPCLSDGVHPGWVRWHPISRVRRYHSERLFLFEVNVNETHQPPRLQTLGQIRFNSGGTFRGLLTSTSPFHSVLEGACGLTLLLWVL